MKQVIQIITEKRQEYFELHNSYPKQITLEPGNAVGLIEFAKSESNVGWLGGEKLLLGGETSCAIYINENNLTVFGIAIKVAVLN